VTHGGKSAAFTGVGFSRQQMAAVWEESLLVLHGPNDQASRILMNA
jgi:hypothetical protein